MVPKLSSSLPDFPTASGASLSSLWSTFATALGQKVPLSFPSRLSLVATRTSLTSVSLAAPLMLTSTPLSVRSFLPKLGKASSSATPLTNVSEYFDQPSSPLVASPLSASHAPLAPPPPPNIPTRLLEEEAALLVRCATNPRSRTEHRAAAQSLAASISSLDDLPPPTVALSVVEPSSYKKALKSPEKANLLLATDKEFSSLSSKGTWHLVPLVSPMRVIGCSWKYI